MPNLSIHPRYWPVTGKGKKHNSARTPKDATKGILGKRMNSLNSRRVGLGNLKREEGYTLPGSQSGRK